MKVTATVIFDGVDDGKRCRQSKRLASLVRWPGKPG